MAPRPLLVLLAFLLLAPPAVAQAPRAVAIVDFVDDSDGGIHVGADRFSAELDALLAARAAGRVRAVSGEPVRAALRARGLTPRDLVSPTRAAEVGAAVGAEWIVTGRWSQLATFAIPDEPSGMTPPPREQGAVALLDVRVLEVSSRRVLLRSSYAGHSFFHTGRFALIAAAREALQKAAAAIAGL